MSGEERLHVYLDSELKRLVDADSRTNKDVVNAELWRAFGGQKQGALENRIALKEQQLDALKGEKSQIQNEIQDVEHELHALKEQVEQMEQEAVDYEEFLDGLLTWIDEGKRCTPDYIEGRDEFTTFDKPADEIVNDCKQRAVELGNGDEVFNTDFVRRDTARQMRYNDQDKPVEECVATSSGGDA